MFDPMKKYRTRCGFPYRLYYVHYDGGQHRAAITGVIQSPDGYWTMVSHKNDLTTVRGDDAQYDLVEVSKYDDWTIDMPCYTPKGSAVHYAGMSEHGEPTVWAGTGSSHTRSTKVSAIGLLSVDEYEALRK